MTPLQRNTGAVDSMLTVHGLFLLFSIGALAVLPSGCSTPRFEDIRTGIDARGHYIVNVPFMPQRDSDCGPAALAGVFAYWKHPIEVSQIASKIYLPKLGGTLPMDMERYAEETGFMTSSPTGSIDALRSALRNDRPVICLLDLGFGQYRQPHYVTVIGFDDGNLLFIMHDGDQANRTTSYHDFEKAWARAGHWMLVATPK